VHCEPRRTAFTVALPLAVPDHPEPAPDPTVPRAPTAP